MFRRLKVLYHKFKSDGLASAAIWLVTEAYRKLIPQKQVIWFTDLAELDSKKLILPDNIEIKPYYSKEEMAEEDYKALIELGTDLMGSAGSILVRERFGKGAVLWLLKQNDQLAGYRWTIVNNHVTPTYFPHTKMDVHSIGIEIFPAFRGAKLFHLFDDGIKIFFKKAGYKRFYSETHLWNRRGVKAFLKTSARKIGTAARFSFFGKNVVIWDDMTDQTDFL